MTRSSRVMLLFLTQALAVACSSNPRVQSDHVDGLDFGGYRTFGFSSRTEIQDPDLAGDLQLYFSACVIEQLQRRGLERSDDPDIVINVVVDTEDVSRPPVVGRNCPSYEDYNSRRVADGYTGEGRRPMCLYTEGSIEIAMVDVAQDQMVWHGLSRVRLDKDDRGIRLLRSVETDVATMFGDLPGNDEPEWQRPTFDDHGGSRPHMSDIKAMRGPIL